MKRVAILIPLMIYSVLLCGQKPVDYLMKGKALIQAGKADDAVQTLTEALAQGSDSKIYAERAEAFMLKGDYSKAISDLNRANELDPSYGEYGLARIYALKGDASTAVYHLGLSMKSAYKKSEKDILLDPLFNAVENTPDWRQFWKGNWYSELEKGVAEIEYDVSTGNIGDARALLKDLSSVYAGEDESIYAGALINLSESKFPEAIKSLNSLLAGNPGNEKYMRLLAKAQFASGNAAGASDTYSELIEHEVADPDLLMLRAECYTKTGETEKASSDINEYLSFYPGDKKALSFAGRLEAAAGDNIKALGYFSQNVKLHPEDPSCYIDRANSYFISGSYDWAIRDYSMSLDLQPGNSDAWLNKGISLLNTGHTEDACHDFRMAFNLGNKKAAEYISRNCIK